MEEPFIFLCHATQVFFSDVEGRLGSKVVLQKEARSRTEVVDISDVFITTRVEANGLIAPKELSSPSQTASLDGAIELLAKDHLLAAVRF